MEPAPLSSRRAMRQLVKGVLLALAVLLVVPLLIVYWAQAGLLGRPRALSNASQALAVVPGLSGQYLRKAFLMCVLAECHPSATIEFGTLFSQPGARIGPNVYIGPRCHLGLVHLERDVLIAAGVHIPSGGQTHHFDDPERPIREQGGERTLVTIGAGAWIGSAAVVMADVGRGTVVGAGAVVTRPLPDHVIAGGVPAKVIRARSIAAESHHLH